MAGPLTRTIPRDAATGWPPLIGPQDWQGYCRGRSLGVLDPCPFARSPDAGPIGDRCGRRCGPRRATAPCCRGAGGVAQDRQPPRWGWFILLPRRGAREGVRPCDGSRSRCGGSRRREHNDGTLEGPSTRTSPRDAVTGSPPLIGPQDWQGHCRGLARGLPDACPFARFLMLPSLAVVAADDAVHGLGYRQSDKFRTFPHSLPPLRLPPRPPQPRHPGVATEASGNQRWVTARRRVASATAPCC